MKTLKNQSMISLFIRKSHIKTKHFDKNEHHAPVSSQSILPAIKWTKQKNLQTTGYNTRKNNYIQIIHQELYKEKEQIKVRKEKETENRKRAREKIEETKLLEGENKKLKQLAKKKDKGSTKKSRRKQLGGK